MQFSKKNTLRFQLFISFSIVFIAILFLIFLAINIYFSNRIKNQQIDSQIQLCASLQESLNHKITTIDTLSKNIVYSKLVRKSFEKQSYLYTQPQITPMDKGLLYSNATECANILSNVIGLTSSIPQVNLYDLDGHMVGYGLYNGLITGDLDVAPWLTYTQELSGKKYVSVPHQMEWIHKDISSTLTPYISLTRTYKSPHYYPIGYIEIIQEYNYFFEYINTSKKNLPESEIYIFNQFNECIYPYRTKVANLNGINELLTRHELLDGTIKQCQINDMNYIITSSISSSSDFTVVVMQPYHIITKALHTFYLYFIPITILCLAIIILLCFAISDRITKPLTQLKSAIKLVDLSELAISSNQKLVSTNTDFEEIKKLVDAFNSMHDKLSQTVNELLLAQNEKINFKILAIQSQMNPHFLHNNLTNISIMAEENMNQQIQETCVDLSYMLRYISTHSQQQVELQQELDYLNMYMNCIKIRYEDDIKLYIDIPENMSCVLIPKLCIQPLVENSIKYALTQMPPWKIYVSGKIINHAWEINVTDNGAGFSPETLAILNQQISAFDSTAQLPDLHIEGMGLLNIYVRLKLLYRDNTIFEIKNLADGGASVTIGGKIISEGE